MGTLICLAPSVVAPLAGRTSTVDPVSTARLFPSGLHAIPLSLFPPVNGPRLDCVLVARFVTWRVETAPGCPKVPPTHARAVGFGLGDRSSARVCGTEIATVGALAAETGPLR